MRFCNKCGAELHEGACFCDKCGNRVSQICNRTTGNKGFQANNRGIKYAFTGVVLFVVGAGLASLLINSGTMSSCFPELFAAKTVKPVQVYEDEDTGIISKPEMAPPPETAP